MKIEFDISDDKIVNFSLGAKNELVHQSQRIASDIVDEASRIEASRRIYDTNSEVTQSNVIEAANQPRMMVVKKKTWWTKVVQIASFISSLIMGSLLDTDKFKDVSHVIWFIIMTFIAIGTTIYVTFNQDNNG